MEDIEKLNKDKFPPALLEIPQPPKKLFIRGQMPPADHVYLAVVGSRKYTSYGREACEKLIAGLKGYPIVIVSGLAIGIDSIAHRAALNTGLITVSFPGSGLDDDVIHPKSNVRLAQEIVDAGGCLISELDPDMRATTFSFPQRNRLMAGIAKAVLIIEAGEKSGTLVTARMATDYNRDVLVVPGSIFSSSSKGSNNLIRQGATPITNSDELLEALGFEVEKLLLTDEEKYRDSTKEEKEIIALLYEPMERDELIRALGKDTAEANAILSLMELKGYIKEELGEIRKI